MAAVPTTIAQVHHRDVTPWRRGGFERTLLRRDQVRAVVHGQRMLEVTFGCSQDEAAVVLDDVAAVTRFPVTEVHWDSGDQPP